jgi:hypothetical protein
MSEPAVPPQSSPLAGLDPGRSKCGLVLADAGRGTILAAAILAPEESLALLRRWQEQAGLVTVVLGNGTGSRIWPPQLARLGLRSETVEEAGTTLAARQRYWQLGGSGGWRRLLPEGLRLPPRDIDDVVAQLLVERHLGQRLSRRDPGVLRQLPEQADLSTREDAT